MSGIIVDKKGLYTHPPKPANSTYIVAGTTDQNDVTVHSCDQSLNLQGSLTWNLLPEWAKQSAEPTDDSHHIINKRQKAYWLSGLGGQAWNSFIIM